MSRKLKRRLLLAGLVGIVLIVLPLIYAHKISDENIHRLMDGIVEQVAHLRNSLWVYYLDNGHAPPNLSVILPRVGAKNEVWFGTLQETPCHLRFVPASPRRGARVHIICGDPVIVEYTIAGDGRIIREKRYPQGLLGRLFRKKAHYPELTGMSTDTHAIR